MPYRCLRDILRVSQNHNTTFCIIATFSEITATYDLLEGTNSNSEGVFHRASLPADMAVVRLRRLRGTYGYLNFGKNRSSREDPPQDIGCGGDMACWHCLPLASVQSPFSDQCLQLTPFLRCQMHDIVRTVILNLTPPLKRTVEWLHQCKCCGARRAFRACLRASMARLYMPTRSWNPCWSIALFSAARFFRVSLSKR